MANLTADKKRIQFSKHALDQMIDRGASEDEIRPLFLTVRRFQQKGEGKRIGRIFPSNPTGKGNLTPLSRGCPSSKRNRRA